MTTKTITIKEDVYNELIKLKRSDESFSDLLLRLANQVNGQKLEAFLGAWDMDPEEFDKIDKEINLIKKNHNFKPVDLD